MKIEGPHYVIRTLYKGREICYRAISQDDCKAWARGWAKPGPYGALFDLHRVNPGGSETHVARFRAGTCKPTPPKVVKRKPVEKQAVKPLAESFHDFVTWFAK